MKKLLSFLVVIFICINITSCVKTADKFTEKSINNTYLNMHFNNYSPRLAYADNSLIYQHYGGKTIVAQSDSGTATLRTTVDSNFFKAAFFPINEMLFISAADFNLYKENITSNFFRYNSKKKSLEKTEPSIKLSNIVYGDNAPYNIPKDYQTKIFIDEFVYMGESYYLTQSPDNNVYVRFFTNQKSKSTKSSDYKIVPKPEHFFVSDDSVYYINNGSLYKKDILNKDKGKKIASGFFDESITLFVNNGLIFYTRNDSDASDALYCYSEKSKKNICVFENSCESFNAVLSEASSTIFVSAYDGIYSVCFDNQKADYDKLSDSLFKVTKLSDGKFSEHNMYTLYVFGEKWLYLIDNENKIFRIPQKGGEVEAIHP